MGCNASVSTNSIVSIKEKEITEYKNIISNREKLKKEMDYKYNELIDDFKSLSLFSLTYDMFNREITDSNNDYKVILSGDAIKDILLYEYAFKELTKHSEVDYHIDYHAFNELFHSLAENDQMEAYRILQNNIGLITDFTMFTNEYNDSTDENYIKALFMMQKVCYIDKSFHRETMMFFLNQNIIKNKFLMNDIARLILINSKLTNLSIALMNETTEDIDFNYLSIIFDTIKLKKSITNFGVMIVNDNINNISKNTLYKLVELTGLLHVKSLGICNFPFDIEQQEELMKNIQLNKNLTFFAYQLPKCQEENLFYSVYEIVKSTIKFCCLGFPSYLITTQISDKITKIASKNSNSIKICLDYMCFDRL